MPTAAKAARAVDHKDPTFSLELRNAISHQPIKTVFKKVYRLLESNGVNGVLLMGDMTDFGRIDGYNAGLAYIANALQLGTGRRHEAIFTGIVQAITTLIANWPSSLAWPRSSSR